MSEIKFRAWDNVDFKMYYLGEEENIHFYFNSNGIMAERFINIKTVVVDDEMNDVFCEKLEHLKYMQYTGLKDKNGNEIYEGDVFHLGDKNIKYVVEWHDTGFMGKQHRSSSYVGLQHWQDRITVIDSIYENPELLEGVR